MGKDGSTPDDSLGQKRRPSSPDMDMHKPKRSRGGVMSAPTESEDSGSDQLRASPTPINSSPPVSYNPFTSTRRGTFSDNGTNADNIQSHSFTTPARGLSQRGQTANQFRPHNHHPTRRDSLKAHLRDVAKIVMRTNFVSRTAAVCTRSG